MKRRGSIVDWLVGLIGVLCLSAMSCRAAKPKPAPPPLAAASHNPCADGETHDPPHHEARPAIQALRARDFDTAQRLFVALLAKYPESASLRVWRGDALLGEDGGGSAAAALDAYSEARALDARGCKLRERERYFLALGVADAELRQGHPEPALRELADAARQWPDSAEVAYHRARAECLQGKRDECFQDLRTALAAPRSGQHLRFYRSHRSPKDMVDRAEQEVEFAEMRKEPRWKTLLAAAAAARLDAGSAPP